MRPDFRLSLLGLEGSRRSGWHQFALQTKLAKYAPKPRGATLHCNRGRLRTLLPRFRTTKTRNRPRSRRLIAMQQMNAANGENWQSHVISFASTRGRMKRRELFIPPVGAGIAVRFTKE